MSWARLLFLSRLTAARVRRADVTSVVQEFVAGLPGDAAALGSYLTRQRAVASALASEAAAAAATALRSLGVLAAGLEARRAGLGQQLAAGAAAVATGAQAGLAGLAQGLGQAGGGAPAQAHSPGGTSAAAGPATGVAAAEPLTVSIGLPALQGSCAPAGVTPGADVPAQCVVRPAHSGRAGVWMHAVTSHFPSGVLLSSWH